MKTLTRIAALATLLLAFVAVAPAQDRQVELSATIPVKRALLSQEIVLGGRVYLPSNDRVMIVADLSFKDAAQLFLQPTDQITVDGEAWLFFTPAENKTRPFAFGGVAQSFFVGAPVEGISSTQAKSGFGIVFKKPSGFTAIPIFTFSTDDLQADRTVLGKAFAFETRLFVPLSSNFNLNLAPFVAREELPGGALYTTKYGIKLGFARKF